MTVHQVIFQRLWVLEDLSIDPSEPDLGPPRM
jgi:hypothetical protein